MRNRYSALHSLEEGRWFKLICGASFQHLPMIRSLALAYTLAGADCIDVATNPAVIAAVQEGLEVAREWQNEALFKGYSPSHPLLMASLNDGEDPHFRKAVFDETQCPTDCLRPCEAICPAEAINFTGVIESRCYGCGRCLPVCPENLIEARSHLIPPEVVTPLILEKGVNAIEIHTQVGHLEDFKRLWCAISPQIDSLKLLAISCPDDADLIDYLHALYEIISPLPCPLIWQTDGRPMSGDIGKGTTHAAVKLAQKVLFANLPGYIQLAGGTNQYTVTKLKTTGLLRCSGQTHYIAGVAYGSYARSLLSPLLNPLETANCHNIDKSSLKTMPEMSTPAKLEDFPDLLWKTVATAHSLVSQIKSAVSTATTPSQFLTRKITNTSLSIYGEEE